MSVDQIRRWTDRDPILAQVKHMLRNGWPDEVLKPYWQRRLVLSLQDNCILWGSRVIILPQGRQQVLEELHSGHPGMCRMKSLARMYMWWPGMDGKIEEKVRRCSNCQKHRQTPPVAPLQPWKWPERPWSRLHLDFAGPLLNHMLLVLVDAYSKWIEIFPMTSSTATATIQRLKTVFVCDAGRGIRVGVME